MNLKTYLSVVALAFFAVVPLRAQNQGGLESDPAYLPIEKAIDLKAIHPEVNVNLPRFLLKDAIAEFDGGTNDPFAAAGINLADLLKDVKLIRVVVIDANKTNQAALAAGVSKLRETLDRHWTAIASVPEENVGVYALGDASGENLKGLALLIHDDGDAVIANIVGQVSLGKVIKVASRFDKLPKDLLKKLSGAAEEKSEKSEKSEKPEKPGKAEKPAPATAGTSR